MLTHTEAIRYVERATRSAEAQSLAIAAVVVDASGAMLAAARMAGVHPINFEAARKKAVTSSAFKMTTADFSIQISRDEQAKRALDKEPEINLLPGGVLVTRGGEVVGALGVAGGFYTQDQAIADYAVSDAE
ncbi:MAG: heme-binding protein [Caulobacterales bacterium]|nr:heme-binding protein [Caulobacterales bacterium]